MPERRGLKRRHLLYYLRVFDQSTGRQIGHLVDITKEGMMVMSERPIRPGRTLSLRMMLPEEVSKEAAVEFEATSLWTGQDINPEFYDTGFKVTNITRRQLAMLETLIEDYGFRD
jgi:hypothetical protein